MRPLQWLAALGIPEECIARKSSCEEKGRRFSINPDQGDEIWRISVDNCWLNENQKKVDYLFWGQSRSGSKMILLVELKGSDYGKALEQIQNTLNLLCKHSHVNRIHNGGHSDAPGHQPVAKRGVLAYVILSTGRKASQRTTKRGRKIPQRFHRLENIRQKYGVRVHSIANRFSAKGMDSLSDNSKMSK